MKKNLHLLITLLAVLAVGDSDTIAQSFNTCTGQTVLSIIGESTSTTTNNTGQSVTVKITAKGADGSTLAN